MQLFEQKFREYLNERKTYSEFEEQSSELLNKLGYKGRNVWFPSSSDYPPPYYLYVWQFKDVEEYEESDGEFGSVYLYEIVRYDLSSNSKEIVGKASIDVPPPPLGGSSSSSLYDKEWSKLVDNLLYEDYYPMEIPMVILSNSDGDVLDSSDIFKKQ